MLKLTYKAFMSEHYKVLQNVREPDVMQHTFRKNEAKCLYKRGR